MNTDQLLVLMDALGEGEDLRSFEIVCPFCGIAYQSIRERRPVACQYCNGKGETAKELAAAAEALLVTYTDSRNAEGLKRIAKYCTSSMAWEANRRVRAIERYEQNKEEKA